MMRDIGHATERRIRDHELPFAAWLRDAFRARRAIGYIAETEEGNAVGCGLLWLQPRPPSPMYPRSFVPYVMSMYTAPEARGRGIATAIVRRLVAWARAEGYPRVELHATPAGRPVYGRLGFQRTDQMRLALGRPTARGRRRTLRGSNGSATPRGRSRSGRSRGTR